MGRTAATLERLKMNLIESIRSLSELEFIELMEQVSEHVKINKLQPALDRAFGGRAEKPLDIDQELSEMESIAWEIESAAGDINSKIRRIKDRKKIKK